VGWLYHFVLLFKRFPLVGCMLYGQFGFALTLASLPAHEDTIEIARQAYLSERDAEIVQLHEMTRPFLPPVKIK
jgi:hypothetical protein